MVHLDINLEPSLWRIELHKDQKTYSEHLYNKTSKLSDFRLKTVIN